MSAASDFTCSDCSFHVPYNFKAPVSNHEPPNHNPSTTPTSPPQPKPSHHLTSLKNLTNQTMARARATKRRKTQAQRYECHTCMVSRISSQFPDSNPTSTCEHMINTYKRCLKDWVESQIETSVFTP